MTRSQQTDHQLCFGDCGRSTKGRWGCILKWISLEQNSFWLMQGWKLGVQTAVCNRARVTVEPSTCSYIHTAVFHWKQNYLWHFRIHKEMKTLWKHRDQWNLHFDRPIQVHFALSPLRENTSSGSCKIPDICHFCLSRSQSSLPAIQTLMHLLYFCTWDFSVKVQGLQWEPLYR